MKISCSHLFWKRLKSSVRRTMDMSGYSIVTPGSVSPLRPVPDDIVKPPYVENKGPIQVDPSHVEIKTAKQIDCMRVSCKLARKILDRVGKSIKVGMTTEEIDILVHDMCINNKAYPSPLLYKRFPKSVCTSVNNVLCHGIPDDRALQNGDIVNVDITVYFNGHHGDTNETFAVGEIDQAAQRLLQVGRQCLQRGIDVCKPGARFCDIGIAVSEHAYSQGCNVIPEITGHGIGSYFHGPPSIFHVDYVTDESSQEMKPGMTFTIEPVITEGDDRYELLSDGWTLVSKDNSRSCQFEHTVLITDTGVEVLTETDSESTGH